MKNLKISVLFLFLTIFSLPVLADDAMLSELIRLDEKRRAEIKTLHVEYNFFEQITSGGSIKNKYEAYGQVWEQLGNDKYRFRVRHRESPTEDEIRRGEQITVIRDFAVDSSVRYELKVPYEAFPVKEPLELCKLTEYAKQRYSGRIIKNPSDVWQGTAPPFLTLPIRDFGTRDSYRELFEKYTPTRVERRQNDAGDEILQADLSGEDEYTGQNGEMKTSRWSITIDFNLSKGGLVSMYSYVHTYDDGSFPTLYNEAVVTRFGESQPGSGHWYPQEYQKELYTDPAKSTDSLSFTRTITNYTLNKKSENQLGPVQFPEGMIVLELDDSEPDKTVTHIWGKNKSEKQFTDEDEFHEYLAKHCSFGPYASQASPKSVSPIRIALLFLGVLLIVAGLYVRRRRKEE
ncbi:MAG: hypothetical protein PHO46_07970 [Thermoguttaceae bacterium]|jgi:hypothetical protein|nr:hypothetical protein [Thermoguttaceae bacterium]